MKINTYIKNNWEKLPKSKFDGLEVVIFKQIENWNEGYGHHTYEGYGVDEDGNVVWCYSSGCSCGGSVDTEIKKDLKVLTVESGIDLDINPKDVYWTDLAVEYTSY